LPVYFRIQQRLLADAIAREKQLLRALVPDREGKHATQVVRTISAKLIVRVHNRFGVAVGVESVAQLLEFFAQLEIVVDLAVEDDPRAAILIVDGLLSALEVNDGQAAHRQTNGAVHVETVFIRAAMTDSFIHPPQQLLVNRLAVVPNDSCDSTHTAYIKPQSCLFLWLQSGLSHLLAVLSLLFNQDEPDRDKYKIKDQQLRPLPVRRSYVSLEDRISNRKHRGKNQNRRNLPQAILD